MYFKPIVAAVLMSLSSKATSVQAAPTELDTRQTAYAQIQGFHDNNCSGNSDVLTDFQANNGACLTLGGYAAVKVTQIGVGCTVTVYTDSGCSSSFQLSMGHGATVLCLGNLPSGSSWNSYRVSNC